MPYTYTLAGSLGGATIQDVVWSYSDPTGAIESFDPAAYSTSVSGNTVSVKFDEDLSTTALGETGIAVVITATVTTTSGPCALASYTVSRTVTIKDCVCGCPVKISPTEYITIKCHNLGADESADWTVPSKELNGNYYQWGRKAAVADVDNLIGSWSASPSSGVDQPDFYNSNPVKTGINTAIKTGNDPCDDGWRMLTGAEWGAIRNNNTFSNNNGEYWSVNLNSFTRGKNITPSGTATVTAYLPAAGYRSNGGGLLNYRGQVAYFWTSTQHTHTSYSRAYNFTGSTIQSFDEFKSCGLSIRCVAE